VVKAISFNGPGKPEKKFNLKFPKELIKGFPTNNEEKCSSTDH
jgi:hypothetical protein